MPRISTFFGIVITTITVFRISTPSTPMGELEENWQVEIASRMRGPVFERARTAEGFAEVFVDAEIGTVTWPGGADLAPDTLYERVRSGAWPVDVVPA